MHGHGWIRDEDNELSICWENLQKVKSRVNLLMKGCGCKFGCATKRCGCRKNGEVCGPGCRCTNCENTDEDTGTLWNEQGVNTHGEDHYRMLESDVSDIMLGVFGQEDHASDTDEDSDVSYATDD